MDFFLSEPLLVLVRFGRFEQLLAEPKPDAKYGVLSGLWHHAQGMALAATGKPADARAHVDAIRAIAERLPADLMADLNMGKALLEVAARVVEARIADAERKRARSRSGSRRSRSRTSWRTASRRTGSIQSVTTSALRCSTPARRRTRRPCTAPISSATRRTGGRCSVCGIR